MQDKRQVWLREYHKEQGEESTDLLFQQWMEIPMSQELSQHPHTQAPSTYPGNSQISSDPAFVSNFLHGVFPRN